LRLQPESFLVIDCGSTTTKALLLKKQQGVFVVSARTEAPTTVEAPAEDITLGVLSAVEQLEMQLGYPLLRNGRIIHPSEPDGSGVDFVGATCSAGGGLQILVAGVIKSMTAASAERAALGAGAIVADVIAIDDGRTQYEKLARIATIRPDIVLVSGGVDGGNVSHVVKMAELLYSAGVRPRHGEGKVPVIFAGNKDARDAIRDILSSSSDARVVDNLRPQLEVEHIAPARQEIQNAFMSHVMVSAPRYSRLAELTSTPVLPTPAAVGKAIEHIGRTTEKTVLACDIGGATTDVFTYSSGRLYRTVSANLGMSYSIANVSAQAGLAAIGRYLPFAYDDVEVTNSLANKMIRPTSLPATPAELALEQAVVRAALRLALRHHRTLVGDVRGVRQQREISQTLEQDRPAYAEDDMLGVDVIIGSGSPLSMAPRRSQAMAMLLDGLMPQGVTEVLLDGRFTLPQIGLISEHYPDIAWQILWSEGLIPLGTVIAPVFNHTRLSASLARVSLQLPNGQRVERVIRSGDLFRIPYTSEEMGRLTITPVAHVDVGAGPGKTRIVATRGGEVGLVLDGRGRPLPEPSGSSQATSAALRQAREMDLFPPAVLADFARRGGEAL
jgi:uncharacterized protein (TIGR01319 family)